jgi:hypothetical protein
MSKYTLPTEKQTTHKGQSAIMLYGEDAAVKRRMDALFEKGFCIVPGSTFAQGKQKAITLYMPNKNLVKD